MAKRKNRKKEYILGLKRQGLVKTTVDVVKVLTEKTEEVKKEVKKEVKAKANDFESFAKEFEGVAASRLEAFYEQGIKSAKDFANWTEKELLTLKGIGPATIKQLKEFGIKFKK
ncbi:Helix-hairpin-helix domain-containing protein [Streptococcus henryi]|uniref:Helix-hairpin-helix domain-containing protein n=1 Tax=Streptococcus henryi TaxID=439219 RepID=A0A1G6AWA9_9STRE|nr:helix-hairpin-helix domain-containing protein [Streptococcus henryi]SDB12680.1 Helix-hairpin-helix domain-containing protein [Streptococcus henryi]